MPRIDPIQLLNCLSVLLSQNGGIKSRDEVQRLASLMTKFSKKLVSKCIYIQILKCTETELLGLFMASGGWLLVHMWLTESIVAKNWPLVRELLELLLLCPVDIDRLKTNNCPKLVKELSKDGSQIDIRTLASKLVEQWLKTVKGEQVIPIDLSEIPNILSDAENCINNIKAEIFDETKENKQVSSADIKRETVNIKTEKETFEDSDGSSDKKDTLPVLKIILKDGKKVVSNAEDGDVKSIESPERDAKDQHKSRSKDKSRGKSSGSKSSSSSSKLSSKSHSSSSDKHKSSSSSSNSHKSSSSSSRRSSKDESKEKDRDRQSSRSKHDSKSKKSSDRSSSSSSKSRDERSSKSSSEKDKSKEKEKDDKNDKHKDTSQKSNEKYSDEKPQSPSIHKLGKIPKLSDVRKEKPSISIEVRKPDEPKPKTVKTYNSRFRSHGLEEEVKPPPSRATLLNKKPPLPALPPSIPVPKRPSPVHNESPPEKKPKIIESIEKPGAIKLIPPKPKPMLLLESDMFMDALNASATNKKEPKKRKRRTSGSKDGNPASDGSPPHTPTGALHSPNSENKSVPPKFYQDTLETDENKEKTESTCDKNDTSEADAETAIEEIALPSTITVNGLKGVLCYHKRKGPKKSIKWKPDSELEEVQYFELDETERVNVTKTFTDMKHLERMNEGDAFQKARNLSTDDIMEEKTSWKVLIPIDLDGQVHVEYGKNSKEKDIQAIRQKGTLQPLYFHKSMIPDSAFEPEPETHPYSEPQIIPLEDVTGNQDNVSDFRNMPWPEPKGNAPATGSVSVPTMFPTNMPQYPSSFPNPQFPGGASGFPVPNIGPGEWPNGINPMMPPMAPGNIAPGSIPMPPGVMPPGNMPPGTMPPGNMPPGMMMPTEGMMMGPDMFGVNQMYPMGLPEGFNMQQNMFPMDFNNMGGPPLGAPGPEGFGGSNNFRGAMRGRGGNSGHWRGKQAGNWDNNQRGRGGPRGGRKVVCIYFQRKGSCRQGDNCTFLHPGVNGPY